MPDLLQKTRELHNPKIMDELQIQFKAGKIKESNSPDKKASPASPESLNQTGKVPRSPIEYEPRSLKVPVSLQHQAKPGQHVFEAQEGDLSIKETLLSGLVRNIFMQIGTSMVIAGLWKRKKIYRTGTALQSRQQAIQRHYQQGHHESSLHHKECSKRSFSHWH